MTSTPKDPQSTSANERQVGGEHYKAPIQHWDFVASNNLDYFQGQITKYVTRWKNKNGLQDLLKAQHFLQKYIELNSPRQEPERIQWNNPTDSAILSKMIKAQEEGMRKALLTKGEQVLSYRDFIFEGSKDHKDSYTCKHCGFKVDIPLDANPNGYHECAKPKGYVNQD